MKYFILRNILFVLLAFFIFSTVAYADYSGTYQSYVNLYDTYRQAERSYVTSKNKYLTYQTLTAEQEALNNGKNFLKLRDQLVILYLKLLYDRVNESGGYTTDERNLIFNKINVETGWLTEHRTKYDSSSTLKDLQRLSDQMQDRYLSLIRYIGLQTAGGILQNKLTVLTTLLEDLLNQTQTQLDRVAESGKDTTVSARWLLEAKNKLSLAKEKQEDAKQIFASLHGQNLITDYNQGAFYLNESNQYLRESNFYLSEIIRLTKGE